MKRLHLPQSSPKGGSFRNLLNLALLATTAVTLVGCDEPDARAASSVEEEAPVEVPSVAATEVETPRYLRLTGTLRGAMEASLAANVSGLVLSVEVDRGDRVEKGQMIARVDVKAARLALAEAQVSVENQKTQAAIDQQECDRYEKLRSSGVVSEQQYDQVMARCKTAPLQLEAAQARKNIAAKNVGDGIIRAPFSGIVTERKIEVGEYVQPSSAVVSMAQSNELRLVMSVPERDIPEVEMGAPVTLRVPAYEDVAFTGSISHLSGAVRSTRDMVVEARVQNEQGKLVPGMFADVQVQVGLKKLPAVPKGALFEQNGKHNLFVKKDGLLYQRVVQPSSELPVSSSDDWVALKAGIQVGDQVVSPTNPNLKNGQKVK